MFELYSAALAEKAPNAASFSQQGAEVLRVESLPEIPTLKQQSSAVDKATACGEARPLLAAKDENQTPSYLQWKEKNKAGGEQVSVLTFNIREDGKMGLPGIIDLIKKSKADVVGLQESEKNSAAIAAALGYHHVQHGYTALLTKYDIDSVTPGGNGVMLHTSSGQKFAVFDKHLYYKPYQPYQLLGIPYQNGKFIKTEAEAISEASKARGADLADLRKDIATVENANLPTIVMGDFNEPSHLDWTEKAAKAGHHPIKVEWPVSKSLADDGFKDSFREVYPDEVKRPGYTWTPLTKPNDPKDHHDRIDFILYRGNGIHVESVAIIGESSNNADIVVAPYPSDHRAVRTVFELDAALDKSK